ncbi:MAG: hypothetical protein ABSD31_03890 [Candidatus Binataceae bacterium]
MGDAWVADAGGDAASNGYGQQAGARAVVSRRSTIFFLLFAVVTALPYHTCIGPVWASEHPDALLLYPCAEEVWSGKREGTDQLTYHVKEWLPASGVIDWISAKLWSENWKPLPYDSLEPNNASVASQVRGWHSFHSFMDPTGLACVQQWLGDWGDSSGNVVRYTFRYKLPEDCAPESDDLEVSAVYIPAPLLKRAQEDFEKFKQEHKAP